MNLFDVFIWAVILLSLAYALYRGFVHSVLSQGALLLSLLIALPLSAGPANRLQGDTSFTSLLVTYTDAVARVGDWDLANTPVTGIGDDTIDQVIHNVGLPSALSGVLERNLLVGRNIESDRTINDYVQGAVVSSAIRILCFLACAALVYALFSLALGLISHVFPFPLLKLFDWAGAALFGVLRGLTFVCVLYLLMPLLSTVIPLEDFRSVLDSSAMSPSFLSDAFFTAVLNGRLL